MLGGFEGPLDLLLELARHHKIDLKQISILKLWRNNISSSSRRRGGCSLNSPPTIW
jgi:hypothetical protein